MDLSLQKRLAASLLKCSEKKIALDTEKLEEIKEAITKDDIRILISNKIITRKQDTGVSRHRARKRQVQRKKGRQKGHGTRKGRPNAREPTKQKWIVKVRLQREFLKELKEKGIVSLSTYRNLYLKSKGGFFRSKRHIKLYLDEHQLAQEADKKKVKPVKANKSKTTEKEVKTAQKTKSN